MYESGVFNIMLFLILLLILFLFTFGAIWNASFGKVEPLQENPSQILTLTALLRASI